MCCLGIRVSTLEVPGFIPGITQGNAQPRASLQGDFLDNVEGANAERCVCVSKEVIGIFQSHCFVVCALGP